MEPVIYCVLLLVVVLLGVGGCSGEPLPPIEADQIEPLMKRALGAEGEDYLHARDRVVGLGKRAVPLLRRLAKEGKTWQERCMADICLERILHSRAVAKLLARDFELPRWVRSSERRLDLGTRFLLQHAKRTPMVLVERLWKGNELSRMTEPRYRAETNGYCALALGIMREHRAGPVIDSILLTYGKGGEFRGETLSAMLIAVGKFGLPQSAPALVHVMGLCHGRDEPAYYRYREGEAGEALASCLRNEPKEVRQAYALKVQSPHFKKALDDPKEFLRKARIPPGGLSIDYTVE